MARSRLRAPAFEDAVEAAEHLTLKHGLQAVTTAEGRGQIEAKDAAALLGSVAIDIDCKRAFPNDNRWDYVIGIQRAAHHAAVFVEVHTADTSGVSEVERKLLWLQGFLQRPKQAGLAALARELHWVASGRVHIPRHLPQYKRLAVTLRAKGLRGPVKHLVLE